MLHLFRSRAELQALKQLTASLPNSAQGPANWAGEAGRGFAVVADEVRKLATRTTEATEQAAEMMRT